MRFRRSLLLPLLVLGLGATAQRADDTPAKMDTTVADTVVVGADGSPRLSDQEPAGVDTTAVADTAQVTADSLFLRSVPDSIVGRWQRNPRFAYANDPEYWRRQPEPSNGFADWLLGVFMSPWFRYFIYLVVGGVLIFVIVRIITDNNLGVFYRKRTVGAASAGERDEVIAEEEDLDGCLQRALDNRDWRRAVRYLYLRTLHGLGEQQLIRLNAQSTNHEYLRQLAGTARESSFRFLTLAYEKVWYGEFTLSEQQFRRLDSLFKDFDKTVKP
jgi:uncharacterized protein DUF4129